MRKAVNTSPAVLQQRHEPLDSLDDFPTPPWATRGFLAEVLEPYGVETAARTVWEPACNRGYMARPLAERFGHVLTSDIADYGWAGQQSLGSFLGNRFHHPVHGEAMAFDPPDWIITNPPFNKGAEFVKHALTIAKEGVAIICRGAFLEGDDRHRDLFSVHMPWLVAQHVERVSMVSGCVDPAASRPTAYSWFVWRKGWDARHYLGTWVPKCRDRYERADDVNFEKRDGAHADFVAQSIADSPLFAHEGGR
jgi:hypothetical protein